MTLGGRSNRSNNEVKLYIANSKYYLMKQSVVAVVDKVMFWFITYEALVQTPDQTTNRIYEKIFLQRFPLSRFLAKILRVKKIALKLP